MKKLSAPQAIKRVMRLMAIPGASGNEAAVAKSIRDELLEAGAKRTWFAEDKVQTKTPISGNQGNLICCFPGTTNEPRRLLMSHLDTVPICVGSDPVRRKDKVVSRDPNTGLGADNRAGCAVTLTAACEILKQGLPHPPLTFLWTVQEEIGLHGARLLNKKLLKNPKLCFNWDGGAPEKLTIGATGGYRMEIQIEGIASHAGGAPEEGVSAIAIASLAIADLHKKGWHGLIKKRNKLGTSNVGVVQGGSATNVICDQVTVRAEARSHDPEFRKRIVDEIEAAFQRAVEQVSNVSGQHGSVQFDGRLDYDSFRIDRDAPCVVAAQHACQSIGLKPEFAIANGGLDANWLSARGLPTVSFGCGQVNQHMKTEALMVSQYVDACEIGLRLATGTETPA